MDTLSVDLEIVDGNADAVISKTKQKLKDFVDEIEKKQPTIKFSVPGESFIDLDRLEKKADETRKRFNEIATVRLNGGQINGLTRDIVSASERSRQLSFDIAGIKKELANPNRKSSIAFLTEELRAAEREADQLDRKLQTVARDQAAGSNPTRGGHSGGLSLGNFAQGGQLRGAGPLFRAAGLYEYGLDESIVNVANSARVAAGVGTGALATFGALAAAGIAVVEISKKIREEEEKRLAVEDRITGAWNAQAQAAADVVQNLKDVRANAASADALDRRLAAYKDSSYTDDILKDRLKTLEDLTRLTEGNPLLSGKAKEYQAEAVGIDKILRDRPYEKTAAADKASDSRWENWKKNQEDARKEEEKFVKSVEEGKTKVEQLQKAWTSAFDSLYQRTSGENPFAAFLAKSQTEADKLRNSLIGLDPELRKIAFAMKDVAEGKELFALRLNNTLGAYDLRNDAANFRNPFDPQKLQGDENQYIQRFLQNNPNYLYLNSGLSQDQIRKDILSRGNFDDPRTRLNKTLDDKYNLIYNRRDVNFDPAAADRAYIAATQGVNPLELSGSNRDAAASAREREASRRERYESEAQSIRREQLTVQKQIVANTSRLNEIAEKGGKTAIDLTLNNRTGDPGTATVGSQDDVKNTFHFDGFGIAGGTNL